MQLRVFAVILAVLLSPIAEANGRSSKTHSTPVRITRSKSVHTTKPSVKCTSCARDNRGRIARSSTARQDFRNSHPCPSTGKTTGACHGYVIDHVVPLKRGGAEQPSNMQWQTVQAAKAKDKIE